LWQLIVSGLSEVPMPILASILDRKQLIAWYQRNRRRSRAIFDLVADEAYYNRPIAQRHPLVFYEGHLPAFSFNTLVNRGLGQPSIDERLQSLFARGIDPSDSNHTSGNAVHWPDRADVRQFADEADRHVIAALTHADLDQPVTRCSIGPKPRLRYSSTKQCTRKRCCTCGTGCRSSRSGNRVDTNPA